MAPGPIGEGLSIRPMPLVVRNSRSALPRSTTLVSPVTIATPQARAAWAMEATIRRRQASSSPSSRIQATLICWGRAPAMARSLAVPVMASWPMSPPGNSRGCTT